MNKAWILTKAMLKMQLSMQGKSNSEKLGYGFLVIALIPFGLMILYFLNGIIGNMYTAFEPLGMENLILGLLFVLMTILFFFLSIGTVLSSFYFAEDVESFIPLPLQPYQILFGKSAVPFLSLYLLNTALLLPSLIFYGLNSGAGVLYYFFSIIMWVITPIIPFVVTSILVMFIMRFANISKNKDRTKIIVGMLGFVFAIGINVLIRMDGGTNSDIAALLLEQNGLLEMVTKFVPTAYFSSIALTEPASVGGILYLLLMIALAIAAVILFASIGQKLYFRGVLGLSGGRRSTFQSEDFDKSLQRRPLLLRLWQKEMRVIFRTPTFFTQIFVQSLFFPVFLIVILLMDMNGPMAGFGQQLADIPGKKAILGTFGVAVIALGVNPASFSSISRDGKSWFNHLYLPIQPKLVIFSKLWTSFTMNLLTLVIISAGALIVLKVPLLIWGIWFLLSLAMSWLAGIGGMLIDLYSPKLNWTDEREVFKGRFITIVPLAVEAVLFGLFIFFLWHSSLEGLWMTTGIVFAFLLLLITLGHLLLNKMVREKYHKIS
ncbi:ABC transporter permease [Halobacillus sp. ACCC02827]|uniref:putative ABC transporter permease subunit n=1 Tax=Halobacillus sp. ACCC02827 TaxID=3052090 RepID=UPI0025707E6B|nr:ABC transporter permease [Halobacillus sp. ACCC02827]WJE16740.1 ABC transporter permease [Halobacillus sp. ACCC02827]